MKKTAATDPKSRASKARGGAARPEAKPEGDAAPHRADRPAFKRGGAVKKGSTVNIVIAPQGGGAQPVPVPVPKPIPVPPPGVGPMPGAPMPPPAGLGAPPMPPGPGPAGPGFARGGAIMAGAGTGVSRMLRSR